MDRKWQSRLHRTRVKLRLKLDEDKYFIAISYNFQVRDIVTQLSLSSLLLLSSSLTRTPIRRLIWRI
jgi:hypothetical protein